MWHRNWDKWSIYIQAFYQKVEHLHQNMVLFKWHTIFYISRDIFVCAPKINWEQRLFFKCTKTFLDSLQKLLLSFIVFPFTWHTLLLGGQHPMSYVISFCFYKHIYWAQTLYRSCYCVLHAEPIQYYPSQSCSHLPTIWGIPHLCLIFYSERTG